MSLPSPPTASSATPREGAVPGITGSSSSEKSTAKPSFPSFPGFPASISPRTGRSNVSPRPNVSGAGGSGPDGGSGKPPLLQPPDTTFPMLVRGASVRNIRLSDASAKSGDSTNRSRKSSLSGAGDESSAGELSGEEEPSGTVGVSKGGSPRETPAARAHGGAITGVLVRGSSFRYTSPAEANTQAASTSGGHGGGVALNSMGVRGSSLVPARSKAPATDASIARIAEELSAAGGHEDPSESANPSSSDAQHLEVLGPRQLSLKDALRHFISNDAVETLLDSNKPWQERSSAIEALTEAFSGRAGEETVESLATLVPHIATFCGKLLRDPNFKVTMTSLALVEALTQACPSGVEQSFGDLIPAMIDKLRDHKIMIRRNDLKAMIALVKAVGEEAMLPAVLPHVAQPHRHVRESLLKLIIAALLRSHSPGHHDDIIRAVCPCLSDATNKVQLTAVETLRVLHRRSATAPGKADQVLGLILKHASETLGNDHPMAVFLASRLSNTKTPLPVPSEEGIVDLDYDALGALYHHCSNPSRASDMSGDAATAPGVSVSPLQGQESPFTYHSGLSSHTRSISVASDSTVLDDRSGASSATSDRSMASLFRRAARRAVRSANRKIPFDIPTHGPARRTVEAATPTLAYTPSASAASPGFRSDSRASQDADTPNWAIGGSDAAVYARAARQQGGARPVRPRASTDSPQSIRPPILSQSRRASSDEHGSLAARRGVGVALMEENGDQSSHKLTVPDEAAANMEDYEKALFAEAPVIQGTPTAVRVARREWRTTTSEQTSDEEYEPSTGPEGASSDEEEHTHLRFPKDLPEGVGRCNCASPIPRPLSQAGKWRGECRHTACRGILDPFFLRAGACRRPCYHQTVWQQREQHRCSCRFCVSWATSWRTIGGFGLSLNAFLQY